MFVTTSDYNVPPYNIPSLTPGEGTTFAAFIDQEEDKYLREVMGDQLYEAFVSGLNDLPGDYSLTVATVIGTQYVYGNDIWEALTVTTGDAPSVGTDWTLIEENNRWLLLKNGTTYEFSGKNYRWKGMNAMVKPLIYANWVEYGAATLTQNGFVTPKTENNILSDPGVYICRAWNEWCELVGGPCYQRGTLYGYLQAAELSSPGIFDDTFDETFSDFVDYLNYEFCEQETRNTFGI